MTKYFAPLRLAGACLVAIAALLVAAPLLAAERDVDQIFENLKTVLPKIEFGGRTYWIVEGDVRVTEPALKKYAQARKEQFDRRDRRQAATVTEVNLFPRLLVQVDPATGAIARWTPGSTITYCVLRQTFPNAAEYADVVTNMGEATGDWAETCNIKFAYQPQLDNSSPGDVPPTGATFTVRKFPLTGGTIASAFFPNSPTEDRHLLVGPAYFTTNFSRVGVLRHELGHVIGMRHEHIRSEAPAACFTGELPGEDTLPVTEYDPTSVMHYFCGGVGDLQLAITDVDRMGSRIVYPFSRRRSGQGAALTMNTSALGEALDLKFHEARP